MIITSPSFNEGEGIPKKFSCEGGDMNPELLIQHVPAEAKSLVLILHDPDAPIAGGFTHWTVWNIDPRTTQIKEESTPPGSIEGRNGAGRVGYLGPCPPSGKHRYYFYLYALDALIGISEEATVDVLKREMKEHIIAEAELMGTYEK